MKVPKNQRTTKPLVTLLIADSFNIFASALLGPIYAIFVKNIGGDLLSTGWSFSVLPIISGTALFILSRFQNKSQNWKYYMIISYLLFSITYALYLWVDSVIKIYVVQAMAGLAYAIGTPAYKSYVSKNLDTGKETSQWGNFDVMEQYASAIGAASGGVIVSLFGFDYLFILMSIMALFSAFAIFRYL